MEEKTCIVCGTTKPLTEFPLNRNGKGFHKRTCSVCAAAKKHSTPEQAKNMERIRENRELRKQGKLRCVTCGEIKDLSNYRRVRGYYYGKCRDCRAIKLRKYFDSKRTPEQLASVMRYRENRELLKDGKRRCRVCGKIKPIDEYGMLNHAIRGECKECFREVHEFTYIEVDCGFGNYHKCPSCGKFKNPGSFEGHTICRACRWRKKVKEISVETCKVCGETKPIINFEFFVDTDGVLQHRYVCKDCAAKKLWFPFAVTPKERGQACRGEE